MNLKLNSQKYFEGKQGIGMNAMLMVDGIDTAKIVDVADGGCYQYTILNAEKFKAFNDKVKKSKPVYLEEFKTQLKLTTDLCISLLDDAQINNKPFTLLD